MNVHQFFACSSISFGFEGGMWSFIVLVPHFLSFLFFYAATEDTRLEVSLETAKL